MKLRIVYDNEARPGFKSGWGFSCLIESKGGMVLLDTGWDGSILLWNLKMFGVDPGDIGKIVLSHQHWDHIGGLTSLHEGAEVYAPESFSKHLKAEIARKFKLLEVAGPMEISDGIWTTGELGGDVREQSLVIRTPRGAVVLTGCGHPGVGEILQRASRFGKIFGIVGGLHDFSDYGLLKGLGLIGATHCTSRRDEIRRRFPEEFVECGAGAEIRL